MEYLPEEKDPHGGVIPLLTFISAATSLYQQTNAVYVYFIALWICNNAYSVQKKL